MYLCHISKNLFLLSVIKTWLFGKFTQKMVSWWFLCALLQGPALSLTELKSLRRSNEMLVFFSPMLKCFGDPTALHEDSMITATCIFLRCPTSWPEWVLKVALDRNQKHFWLFRGGIFEVNECKNHLPYADKEHAFRLVSTYLLPADSARCTPTTLSLVRLPLFFFV